jgi:hypothetical protein
MKYRLLVDRNHLGDLRRQRHTRAAAWHFFLALVVGQSVDATLRGHVSDRSGAGGPGATCDDV